MVSTRQMTIGGGNSGSGDESTSFGPARYTRSGSGSGDESAGPSTSRYTRTSNAAVAGSSGNRAITHSRNILELPQEILEKILKHLSFKNICQARLVSKSNMITIYNTLNSQKSWKTPSIHLEFEHHMSSNSFAVSHFISVVWFLQWIKSPNKEYVSW